MYAFTQRVYQKDGQLNICDLLIEIGRAPPHINGLKEKENGLKLLVLHFMHRSNKV